MDKGLPLDFVYLDFSKAFDKEPHNRLINKIKSHGIGCLVANWIESRLSNRYQRVVFNGHMTDWLIAFSGVPQGSVWAICFSSFMLIFLMSILIAIYTYKFS